MMNSETAESNGQSVQQLEDNRALALCRLDFLRMVVREVFQAAVARFSRTGFRGTDALNLTKTAGIPARILYEYFGSKEFIFEAFEKYHSARGTSCSRRA